MKNFCCLCNTPLKKTAYRYKIFGNFCRFCTMGCDRLSRLRPTLKESFDAEDFADYERRLHFYEVESIQFQLQIKSRQSENLSLI